MIEGRWVIDTNVLISRFFWPEGPAAHAVRQALRTGDLLMSDATWTEFAEVLMRPKFDRFLTIEERETILSTVGGIARRVPVTRRIRACRDPRDDKFLELAVCARASALLSGDDDLLALHPFQGIPVLGPADFILRLNEGALPIAPAHRSTEP